MEKKRSLFIDVLAQVFIKPRGILKMGQVWLPFSLILVAGTRMSPRAQFWSSLYLLFAVLSKGLSSILINDLTDREIDRRAGKERWITDIPLLAGILIPVFLLSSGFFALIKAGGDVPVFASFTATVLLGTLYSLKPVRFKERGIWGILAYSSSAAILNVLVPWTLFRPVFLLLPLLFTVVIGEKLIQILFHQIADFQSDAEEKVKSFAVTAGRDKANRTLHSILNIVMVAETILLIYILFEVKGHSLFFWLLGLAALFGVAASGLYVKIISQKYKTATKITEMLPWAYLGLSYVLFYVFPPILLFMLALRDPEMWVLVTLSVFWFLGISINYFFYDPKK